MLQCDDLIHIYIVNDYHSQDYSHIHSLIQLPFFFCSYVLRTLKINFLGKFQVFNKALTIVTKLYN